jgi:hypothetical protein
VSLLERPQPTSAITEVALVPAAAAIRDQPRAPSAARKLSAFDQALSFRMLREAADDYASRHGRHGSAEYRAAWLRFRQRVKSLDDLQRIRAKASRTSAKR